MVLNNLLQAGLYHKKKYKRQREKAPRVSITRLLLPSCITLILSTACFVTATWGWFTANQSCGVANIQLGSFGTTYALVRSMRQVENASTMTFTLNGELEGDTTDTPAATEPTEPETEVIESESRLRQSLIQENVWRTEAPLAAGVLHEVTLTTEGTVGGFCTIEITEHDPEQSGETLHLSENRTLYYFAGPERADVSFYLLLSVPCDVTVTSYWGEPVDSEEIKASPDCLEEGEIYGNGEIVPIVFETPVKNENSQTPVTPPPAGTSTEGETTQSTSPDTTPAGATETTDPEEEQTTGDPPAQTNDPDPGTEDPPADPAPAGDPSESASSDADTQTQTED